jgi:hypothetical protein
VKVVKPSPLLAEAAEVLAPVRDAVVIVGAAALEVALHGKPALVTPTRDVDVVVPVERAAEIIKHLTDAEMHPSQEPHERGFTWVRGDLKVQLVRTYHPFAKPPAKALPENPVFGMADKPVHQTQVAFDDEPTAPRLIVANAVCLIALKQAAFGRVREPDRTPVERDYHDAFLLMDAAAEDVSAEYAVAEYEVRSRVSRAIEALAAGGDATAAAGRQIVRAGQAANQRAAEAAVRTAARRLRVHFT